MAASNLQSVYDYIKQRLSNLKSNQTEHFVLPPYSDSGPPPSSIFQQYSIDPKEYYDVVAKFDLPPSSLNDVEKELRKKYLNILLNIIKNERDNVKRNAASYGPEVYNNYDAFTNLVVRIINLMINELSPQLDAMPFIIALAVVCVLLLLMSSSMSMMMRKPSN